MDQRWTDNEITLLSQVLPHVAEQLRPSLTNLHLAVTRLVPPELRDQDAEADTVAAVTSQSYFRLLRVVNNLSCAPQLLEDTPFLTENTEVVSFLDALCRQAESLAQESGLTLSYKAEPSSLVLAIDREQLERLVWNLLSNAFKFTQPGGRITVSLKKAGTQLLLTISDTGCGISEELMPTVFDRWLHVDRTDPSPHGLGLGLPLCRNIAERHGGRLLLQSETGKGTTVTVALPCCKNPGGAVRDVDFDYAGGFQRVLLELADALPYGAYRQKHLDE